jgi:hypothetical protein
MTRSLTESTLNFARAACEVGRRSFPLYAAPKSPHRFKQYQIFAVLALRLFLGKSYRMTLRILSEWAELRQIIGLTEDRLPNHSTLIKAQNRLKKSDLKNCLELLSNWQGDKK